MRPLKRCSSHSFSSLPTVDLSSSEQSLGGRLTRTKQPYDESSLTSALVDESDEDSECEPYDRDSLSDDDLSDQEEIIVDLNPRAMAQLPRPLQKIMIEMHAERYIRLKRENPNVRVMPDDYWIRRPVRPTYLTRFPTPLLALPQPVIREDAFQVKLDFAPNAQQYIQSFGPGNPRRWSAQPTTSGNAFAASQYLSHRYQRQTSQIISQPKKEFRVINSYHKPLPANLMVPQKLQKHKNTSGNGLKSLSIKPVASNLRDRFKRSLLRLNKWMKM